MNRKKTNQSLNQMNNNYKKNLTKINNKLLIYANKINYKNHKMKIQKLMIIKKKKISQLNQ